MFLCAQKLHPVREAYFPHACEGVPLSHTDRVRTWAID